MQLVAFVCTWLHFISFHCIRLILFAVCFAWMQFVALGCTLLRFVCILLLLVSLGCTWVYFGVIFVEWNILGICGVEENIGHIEESMNHDP